MRDGPDDPSQELWARWMQFSAYGPSYEIMLGTNHTPYYPPYTSRLVDVLKSTSEAHHLLIPYIKSLTYGASTNGVPVLRALLLEAPQDSKGYEIADEYFLGDAFLAAPIVTQGGARQVYFPQGSKYLEYFNKTAVHQGGSTASVSLEIEYTPLYVRAGSIVPKGDIVQLNNKWTKDWKPSLTVEVFPSFDVPMSTFTYYNGTAVQLEMRTDSGTGDVVFSHGNLGLESTLVVYTQDGIMNKTLTTGAGNVTISGVKTLFE